MDHGRQSGFTLIEVIVVIAVLAMLAGLALPMIGSTSNDARVTKMLANIAQYRTAVQRFKNDTRSYPVEVSDAQGGKRHQLSMKQDQVVGWKGPYLDHVLSTADNPFAGSVVVYNNLDDVTGFDLDGDGRVDARGEGSVVVYTNVDEESAQQIDAALDKGIAGDWQETGRVEWRGSKTLIVLLHQD